MWLRLWLQKLNLSQSISLSLCLGISLSAFPALSESPLRVYSNWIVCGSNRELLTFCHVCLSLLRPALLSSQCSLPKSDAYTLYHRVSNASDVALWPVSLYPLILVVSLAINANLQHLKFTRDFSWAFGNLYPSVCVLFFSVYGVD